MLNTCSNTPMLNLLSVFGEAICTFFTVKMTTLRILTMLGQLTVTNALDVGIILV